MIMATPNHACLACVQCTPVAYRYAYASRSARCIGKSKSRRKLRAPAAPVAEQTDTLTDRRSYLLHRARFPLANGHTRPVLSLVMGGLSHLFCPTSGSLLDVDGDKGVVACPSSGYSRKIAGLLERLFNACAARSLVVSETCTCLLFLPFQARADCAEICDACRLDGRCHPEGG
jgi:hypothetical protein